MNWFLENFTPANIAIGLSVACLIWCAGRWALWYLERGDEAFRLANPIDDEDEHAKQIDRANEQYYGLSLKARRDLAELKRVTKQ